MAIEGHAKRIIALSFVAFAARDALSDTRNPEFLACLARTREERVSCSSGCGMIIQQCYDEADDTMKRRIDALVKKEAAQSPVKLRGKNSRQLHSYSKARNFGDLPVA